jgi:hypothetical protein
MDEQQHTCPRRAETRHDDPTSPFVGSGTNLDTWRDGTTGASCSYCGSLHPGKFMELVREGWIVGPTDKSYKAYLSRPASVREKADRKTTWLDQMTRDGVEAAALERGETPEEFRAALADHYDREVARSEAFGSQEKFYFQHLTPEQRDEFIELHNSRQMNVGYPGHFYQLPFFASGVPREV